MKIAIVVIYGDAIMIGSPADVGDHGRWKTNRFAMQKELGYRIYLVGIGKDITERSYGGEERERGGERGKGEKASSEEGQRKKQMERRLEINFHRQEGGDWGRVELVS